MEQLLEFDMSRYAAQPVRHKLKREKATSIRRKTGSQEGAIFDGFPPRVSGRGNYKKG